MSITIERVKELRASAKRTPWQHDPDDERAPIRGSNGAPVIEAELHDDVWVDAWDEDVALMAAAPDIADLCIAQAAEIERLRGLLAEALQPMSVTTEHVHHTENGGGWSYVTVTPDNGSLGDQLWDVFSRMENGINFGIDVPADALAVVSAAGTELCRIERLRDRVALAADGGAS